MIALWLALSAAPASAAPAREKPPIACDLKLPRLIEGACEGEMCGPAGPKAKIDFAVRERPDPKSKTIATLKAGTRLQKLPIPVIQVHAAGTIRVYDSLADKDKKNLKAGRLYHYLHYLELGTYQACVGKKLESVGSYEEDAVDILTEAKRSNWYRVEVDGKTGYIEPPEPSRRNDDSLFEE